MNINENEVVIFDTETNGMINWKMPSADKNQPHIVQLGAVVVDVNSHKVKQSINVIVKPEGWIIPEEITKIHGITTEYAIKVGLPERDVIRLFLKMLGDKTRIAHNTTFDNRIIRIGIKRFFDDAIADNFNKGDYYCTLQHSKKIMGGKSGHTLTEALKYFTDKVLIDAHDAMADTIACMDIYFSQKNLAYLRKIKEK